MKFYLYAYLAMAGLFIANPAQAFYDFSKKEQVNPIEACIAETSPVAQEIFAAFKPRLLEAYGENYHENPDVILEWTRLVIGDTVREYFYKSRLPKPVVQGAGREVTACLRLHPD